MEDIDREKAAQADAWETLLRDSNAPAENSPFVHIDGLNDMLSREVVFIVNPQAVKVLKLN